MTPGSGNSNACADDRYFCTMSKKDDIGGRGLEAPCVVQLRQPGVDKVDEGNIVRLLQEIKTSGRICVSRGECVPRSRSLAKMKARSMTLNLVAIVNEKYLRV